MWEQSSTSGTMLSLKFRVLPYSTLPDVYTRNSHMGAGPGKKTGDILTIFFSTHLAAEIPQTVEALLAASYKDCSPGSQLLQQLEY